MSESIPAVSGAATILQHCLGLTQGADLLLLVDETALSVVDPFWTAARRLGINLTTLFYSREQQLQIEDLGRLDRDALESAEAAILAHTADDAYSRFRTKLVSQWRNRTRLATMPGAEAAILEIASRSNYAQMSRRCAALTPPLLNGRECVVTTYSRDGTPFVLRFALGGMDRIPVHSIGILRGSAWGNVPSGEIFTAPLETSADGEYLVDGTIGRHVIDPQDPAVLTFRGGRLVGHRGLTTGNPVPYLREVQRFSLDRHDDGWNVIAEFGIGVNEGIDRVWGIPLIDEKIFSTVHIGLGNNVGWQGVNQALLHLDVITWRPDVTIDGRSVLQRGSHDFDPGSFDDLETYVPPPGLAWPEGGLAVKFNRDGYSIQKGRFKILLRDTQSGRITEFPIANERTNAAARRLARLAHGQALDLRRLSVEPDLPSGKDLEALLSLLRTYGVIEPAELDRADEG
jgi:hypothetical protein